MRTGVQRRDFIVGLAGTACWPFAVRAQRQSLPTIGWLSSGSNVESGSLLSAFRDGLARQGYREGDNIWIYDSWAEGHYDQLVSFAKAFVEQKKVLVIVAAGGAVAAVAALSVTTDTPILFVSGFDPVQLGFVRSLANPGGNATGVSVYTTELTKKRFQLLHQITPDAHTIAYLLNPNATTAEIERQEVLVAGRTLGIGTIICDVGSESDIEKAFLAALNQKAGAFVVGADPFLTSKRKLIVDLAMSHRLPGCFPWREYVKAGGLLSYGPDLIWAYQQLGIYAGRILKGAKVSELPVQQPTDFKLFINNRTAKLLGLTVPTALLATADEVIE